MGWGRRGHRFGIHLLLLGTLVLAGCGGDHDDGAADGDDGPTTELAAATGTGGPTEGASTIAIVGDAGELNDDTVEVAQLIGNREVAAVFTVGDNEYTTEGRTVASFQESVGDVYGPWLAASRFYPIPGDHDYGDACDGDADLDAYLEFFDLPVGPEDETYYSVRLGDVEVFTIDTLVDCHGDGGVKLERERQWLAEAATSSDAPMKIALLHNPPYSSGTSHGSVEELRWDFADWGVDMVVSGDDHIYERSTHDGVAYVVNGLGGVEAHELGDPIEGSEILFADAFGAMFVTTTEAGGADVSFVTVDGSVVDEFTLGSGAQNASGAASEPLGVGTTWTWQLLGDIDTTVDADVYDVDLFDTSDDTIAALQADGRSVICYFSAGSYEEWRPDADQFDESDLGKPLDGWEGERWLDIRSPGVEAVVEARLDLARERGCDGVEPDNVDGHLDDSGFDLTADDQLAFNRTLADAAHARGLLVGLKNDGDQIPELVDRFDFAVNEQCHEFDECDVVEPFVAAGKPVFNAEYAQEYVDDPAAVCSAALDSDLRTLIVPLELDGSFRIACDDR